MRGGYKIKLTYEYVYNYFKEQNCELLETEYINARTKMKYKCKCNNISYITFSNFKQGQYCKNCGKQSTIIKQTLKIEDIRELLLKNNWELLENNYISNTTKMLAKCPVKHEVYITVGNFKQGHRCKICQIENLSGENNPMWIEDRSKIEINERLRQKKTSSWILNNLINDKNYENYKNHLSKNKINKLYQLDHIIPIFSFRDYMMEYNLNEEYIRKIANNKLNLQILTSIDNILKRETDYKTNKEVFFKQIKLLEQKVTNA